MHLSRRDALRRLAGLATAASLWASTLFVLDDEIPSVVAGRQASNNGRRNSGTAPGRQRQADNGTTTSPEGSTSSSPERSTSSSSAAADETTTTHHHEEATTTSSEDGTTTTSAGDDTTTTHDHDHGTEGADLPAATAELVGSIGPVLVPAGEVAKIVGDVNLKGDLVVEGVLTGVSAFTLQGNGFQILVQKGGRLDLRGNAKTGWARVGQSVSGWSGGDRLAIAPTAPGDFSIRSGSWSGSWSGVGAPAPAQLPDGSSMHPEVANLSRSITLKGISRIMIHDGAGVQNLRHIAVQDCGRLELGFYPIHFHMLGNSASGSVVEGVVVEGSRFRAFVPHGSHGITMKDCVALNIAGTAYWWDSASSSLGGSHANDSNSTLWDRCLAMGVKSLSNLQEEGTRTSGFRLGSGSRNVIRNCAATAIGGRIQQSGFHWPSHDHAIWTATNLVAHNNSAVGLFAWQNDHLPHVVDGFVGYSCGKADTAHGAYRNSYQYHRVTAQKFELDAISVSPEATNRSPDGRPPIRLIDSAIGNLHFPKHTQTAEGFSEVIRTRIGKVTFAEAGNASWTRYVDCGVTPDTFNLSGISKGSRIEIVQGGTLARKWEKGSWS